MSGFDHVRRALATGLYLMLLLMLLGPVRAQGQSWALVDGLGYGAAGTGVGAMGAWNLDYDEGFAVIALATGAGIAVGALVGHAADTRLARGEGLGGGHKAAVVAGSVLAGATLGALASAALINGEGEDTFLGSDETTFTTLTLAGTALGAAVTWWRRDALRPRGVSVSPAVSPDGGAGLRVRVTF